MKKIVIIIPTYNEAASLAKTITGLENIITQLPAYTFTLLIFDSNSKDTTLDVIAQLQLKYNNIIVLNEREKSGLGSAYLQAMRYSCNRLQADIIFEYDADGSHQPQYIIPMLQALASGADVALGSRYIKDGKCDVNWPWHRQFLSRFGNYVARVILTSRYKDFTSGFRATRAVYLEQALKHPFLSNNYAYKLQLLWDLHCLGAHIVEIPIHFIDREKGSSKLPKNSIFESLTVLAILRYHAALNFFKKK